MASLSLGSSGHDACELQDEDDTDDGQSESDRETDLVDVQLDDDSASEPGSESGGDDTGDQGGHLDVDVVDQVEGLDESGSQHAHVEGSGDPLVTGDLEDLPAGHVGSVGTDSEHVEEQEDCGDDDGLDGLGPSTDFELGHGLVLVVDHIPDHVVDTQCNGYAHQDIKDQNYCVHLYQLTICDVPPLAGRQ